MRDVVASYGGKLVPVKSVASIFKWAQCDQARAYVLVTDWREVQPFMNKLQDMSDVLLPCFTVVLCSSQWQFHKASHWAKSLPSHVGRVYTCMVDQIPSFLLAGVIRECFKPIDDATSDGIDIAKSQPVNKRQSLPAFKEGMEVLLLPSSAPVTLVRAHDDVLTIKELGGN
mmetsp:Transcript_50847/g.101095  ORF Transcript_50847/g.101095 Transcript_50847/m.101095 type:complete len:171 (+) Transcript_50847:160-672(+)